MVTAARRALDPGETTAGVRVGAEPPAAVSRTRSRSATMATNSRGVPSATRRPRSMMPTRSQSRSASSM